MTRRLVLAMTALAAVVAIALAIPLALVVAGDQREAFVSRLEVQTLAAASRLASQPVAQWAALAEEAAEQTGARVVIVAADLQLLSDSDDGALDRQFDRPEIEQALGGALASDVRGSQTLGTPLRFVAAPVIQGEQVVAAIRLSLPEDELDASIRATQIWLALFVVAVVGAAALVALMLAWSIAAPLRRLAEVATALPDDLSLRASGSAGPSEVRAVARALNATAVRLGGLIERTQRVAADASHHLKTPLTGVRLRLEAIEDISSEEDVRSQAAAATAEVDRLSRRIDQVLALARSDAGAQGRDSCAASVVVADRVAATGVIAMERGLEVQSRIQDGVVAAASAGVLSRAVDELLGNAMDYARTTVRVTLSASADQVSLVVEDDGPGIPQAERGLVFERFRRGGKAVPGGSGLGLALVRESALACGGQAEAESAELGGLAVRTTWPRALSPSP
jgi:signal transduction histidine kinase